MITTTYTILSTPVYPPTYPAQGTTIQLVCFLLAEFPVQMLTKRFGFRLVLPTMMMAWSTVCMLCPGLAFALTTDCFAPSLGTSLDHEPCLILRDKSIDWCMRGWLHSRNYPLRNILLQIERACDTIGYLLVHAQRQYWMFRFASPLN